MNNIHIGIAILVIAILLSVAGCSTYPIKYEPISAEVWDQHHLQD